MDRREGGRCPQEQGGLAAAGSRTLISAIFGHGRGHLGRTAPLSALLLAILALALAASPAMASDGTGTMSVSPSYVVSGSSGNYITLTYTVGAGGMTNGDVTVLVPSGWTPPSNAFNNGGVGGSCVGAAGNGTTESGQLITVSGLTLSAGSTCTIQYGINGFNSGDTAPSTAGANTFTTQERSTSAGTLTNIASQPVVTVGDDGTGTMVVSPTHVVAGTTGSTLTFTYTATRAMSSGQLTIAVPAGWSTPSTNSSAAGYTTSTCGTVGASGSTIQNTGVTQAASGTCTIVYGSRSSGGPGATAPSSGGPTPFVFTTQQEATNDNNLVAVNSGSPQVTVTAADGAGTNTVSPTQFIQNSTGNYLTFTYTVPAGGMANGTLTLLVPSGWTPPSNAFNSGGIGGSCVGAASSTTEVGQLVTMSGLSLTGGSTCTIQYGINGFNSGVTAPSAEGSYTFTTQQESTATGTLTNIATQPVVTVGNDGTGTMVVAPTHAVAGSSGNTLTFTYTAADAISSGALSIAVPSGWSVPATSASAAGATTSTCGTVGVSGSTIQVTGVNLADTATCTVTYGNTAGGPGATAPSSGGPTPLTFTAQESSSSGGTLTTLSAGSPQVTVTAGDGVGTMTESPSTVIGGSTGNYLTFTYTVPAGGMANGTLTLLVPSGWTPPSNAFNSGGIGGSCVGAASSTTEVGQLVTMSGLSLAGGSTCTIQYGINGFNSGVTAPSTAGPYTFTAQEKSTAAGTLTSIGSQPVVTVGSDGLGTMGVAPTHAVASSSANTLTFTYTAAATITNGGLTIAVPAGWSAPSTSASAAGATTSTCGAVGVSGSTILVTGVNVANAATCTVTYGDMAGGPGATAPSSGGPTPATFTTQEKSSSGGTLTSLSAGSPQVTVTAGDGVGTMTESPSPVTQNSTGNYLTFTYTVPAGGMANGVLTLLVPNGWTPPAAGSSAGGIGGTCVGAASSTTEVGQLVTMSGLSLNGGSTCTIQYGINGFNSGVTAPSTTGPYTFTAQEKSTAAGTLTSIASQPVVDVAPAVVDGTGTMNVSPSAESAGATGSTLTFTYNSAVVLSSGEITVALPAGWSAPSTSGTDPGYTTSTCGTVGVSGNTIQVTGISIGSSASCSITYGDTGSAGPGATVTSTLGTSAFPVQEKSNSGGNLTDLASSPQLTVYAPDGSGTMSVAPGFAGSSGNTLTFTYTAASGGVSNGKLLVAVPAGWSGPSTTPGVAGYTTSTCGSVGVPSGTSTIQVVGVSLSGAGTCTITYGSRAGGGTGANAPSSPGNSTFASQETSQGGGTAANLASSPGVDVTSADGTGTLTVDPAVVDTGSSANTLTFTFTAAPGGTNGGELDVNAPAAWSAPSTTSSAPGYTTSGCGTVAVSGPTIQVTGVTLAGGGTCTIVYGDQSSGGPGATAPSSDGDAIFATNEMGTGLGTLTSLASSPDVATSTFKTLTVTVIGSGTVTGGGISCPGTCSKSYPPGTVVSLSASPASGFTFSDWGGACSGTAACSVTMSDATAVSGTFAEVSSGGGTGSGGGGTGSGGGGTGSGGGGTGGTGGGTGGTGGGTGGTGGGTGGTGGTKPAPKCSLTAVSNKVSIPKHKHQGTLTLKATCDQASAATLRGAITEVFKTHGKRHTKVFQLGTVHATLNGGARGLLVMNVPAGALDALQRGAAESASFTLTATNANGTARVTAGIRALKT